MRATIVFISCAFFSIGILTSVSFVARAAEEPVTVTSRYYAAPGREAEVESRFLKIVEFVRKAEPNITYRLYRSNKDPSVFLFFEVYHRNRHLTSMSRSRFRRFEKNMDHRPKDSSPARPRLICSGD
jgi:quinol monooxygenase YgiN